MDEMKILYSNFTPHFENRFGEEAFRKRTERRLRNRESGVYLMKFRKYANRKFKDFRHLKLKETDDEFLESLNSPKYSSEAGSENYFMVLYGCHPEGEKTCLYFRGYDPNYTSRDDEILTDMVYQQVAEIINKSRVILRLGDKVYHVSRKMEKPVSWFDWFAGVEWGPESGPSSYNH